jgi:hypothetical protein
MVQAVPIKRPYRIFTVNGAESPAMTAAAMFIGVNIKA